VTSFVPGTGGQVNCDLPSGLEAGHYSIYVLEGQKWVRMDTLVRVLAPVVLSASVPGGNLQSSSQVTLEGLYFSNSPTVSVHYLAPGEVGAPQSISQSLKIASAVQDPETGLSQVQVQVQSLGTNNPTSCVFEVQSPNGSAFFNYDANAEPSRGQFISATKGEYIKKGKVWNYLVESLADNFFYKIVTDLVLRATKLVNQSYHYDLQLWNMNYWTIDTSGNLVVASGVVILPQGTQLASLLSFQHGTMLMKVEAPTLSDGPELAFAATFAATDGYVTSVPDHLGLGQAAYRTQMSLTHPYCEAVPLAENAIDMMDALKTLLAQQNPKIALKDKLFMTGYSEGGYATMALHREVETTDNDMPTLIASANMDGPYSLAKVMLDRLMSKTQKFPVLYFAPYLLVAYNKDCDIYPDASYYMQFPYNMTVAPLINGYISESIVNSQMPQSQLPRDALLPSVAAQLDQYTGPIFTQLQRNDLVPINIPLGAWCPKAPAAVIHGRNDDCVPYGNLTAAQTYFNTLQAPHVNYYPIDSWLVDNLPGMKHALYCPFAMGIAWEYFHNMTP
jgi:hypothetical protein